MLFCNLFVFVVVVVVVVFLFVFFIHDISATQLIFGLSWFERACRRLLFYSDEL